MVKRNYGWLHDIPDQRDVLYKRPLRLFLPSIVDLRPVCSPVEAQGDLGSCTAQALAGNMEYLDRKMDGVHSDVSRLFIYYNERKIEGTVNEDSGAYIRDGIKTLAKEGACSEELWPYSIARFKDRPGADCYSDGLTRRISTYQRLSGIDDMFACLADGYPVVFGIPIYESFEMDDIGIIPVPEQNEIMLGGHAMCAVGYDRDKKWFIVRNSWGVDFGDKGYCYIPFDYMKQAEDRWTIRKLKEEGDEEGNSNGGNGCFVKRGLQRFVRRHIRATTC
jgi:C1A family cysteine protease